MVCFHYFNRFLTKQNLSHEIRIELSFLQMVRQNNACSLQLLTCIALHCALRPYTSMHIILTRHRELNDVVVV